MSLNKKVINNSNYKIKERPLSVILMLSMLILKRLLSMLIVQQHRP